MEDEYNDLLAEQKFDYLIANRSKLNKELQYLCDDLSSLYTRLSTEEDVFHKRKILQKFLIDNQWTRLNSSEASCFKLLRFAAQFGDIDTLKLLSRYRINVNQRDESGNTALSYVCWRFYGCLDKLIKTVEYLLDYLNADVTVKNNKGECPLFMAFYNFFVMNRDYNVICEILVMHAQPIGGDEVLNSFYKFIDFLLYTENDDVPKKLAKLDKILDRVKMKSGQLEYLLYFVVLIDIKDVVQLVINKGADINYAGEDESKRIPVLVLAAKTGRLDAVEILLRHGADVDATDHDGKSALHYAKAFSREMKFFKMEELVLRYKNEKNTA